MIFIKFVFIFAVNFFLPRNTLAHECVEYLEGNVNIVITVPHGGYNKIEECPKRQRGCLNELGQCYYDSSVDCDRTPDCPAVVGLDTNTQEMAPLIADSVEDALGKRPHVVIMKCTRDNLDVNREINEAAQQCPEAKFAYNAYHGQIKDVLSSFGEERGLLLDFHGQAHHQNSTEFGYAILKEMLDYAVQDPVHEFPMDAFANCSIRSLLARLTADGTYSKYDVIFGSQSIGLLLENEGFAALPGPYLPAPGEYDYKYFNGGYTVRTYGSKVEEDKIEAIQMETPSEVRVEGGQEMREKFAVALGKAIANFYEQHFL